MEGSVSESCPRPLLGFLVGSHPEKEDSWAFLIAPLSCPALPFLAEFAFVSQ